MVDLLRLDLDLFPRMQSPKEAQEDGNSSSLALYA
jgi:hypothetical protein